MNGIMIRLINESIHLTNRLIHISIFQIEQKWTLDLDFTGLKKKKNKITNRLK